MKWQEKIGMQVSEMAVEYLLKEANVPIKYRVMTELCDEGSSPEIEMLKHELEKTERAKQLMEYLIKRKEYHGATLYAAENSLNMLVDMGFAYKKGFFAFDRAVEELEQEAKHRKRDDEHLLRFLPNIVIVPFLLRTGMRESWMVEFVKERIDIIYDFVQQKDYDIYLKTEDYKGMPPSFSNRPVIRYELCENGQIKLPLEYDIHAFSFLYKELPGEYRNKVDEILVYILHGKFQQIVDGYGIISDGKKYWALGWDPKPTNLKIEYKNNPLLLKMELLSNFRIAVESEWFCQALKIIENYKTTDGRFYYPGNYLTEKNSCWILGNHMGLGENRRQKQAICIEGTYRTQKIFKNIEKLK